MKNYAPALIAGEIIYTWLFGGVTEVTLIDQLFLDRFDSLEQRFPKLSIARPFFMDRDIILENVQKNVHFPWSLH